MSLNSLYTVVYYLSWHLVRHLWSAGYFGEFRNVQKGAFRQAITAVTQHKNRRIGLHGSFLFRRVGFADACADEPVACLSGIEVDKAYLGKGWSVVAEGNWSWWTFGSSVQKRDYQRIQAAGLEMRKWIGSRQALQGHAAGLYVLGGIYDIRPGAKDETTRGLLSNWSWSAGISYSYSMQ